MHHRVKGSESYTKFRIRTLNAFQSILKKDAYRRIAIISHGRSIRCFIEEFLKQKDIQKLGDCAFLELENKNTGFVIVKIYNTHQV